MNVSATSSSSNSFNFSNEMVIYRRNPRQLVNLCDAKRLILGITNDTIFSNDLTESYVSGIVNYFILANNNNLTMVDIAQARLHALCVVGNVEALRKFLIEFVTSTNNTAVELLVNSSIKAGNGVVNCVPFLMTPMLCALLWNNNPELIRLLYAYGAKPNQSDVNNIFPEEKIMTIPFFDHLSGQGWGGVVSPLWRDCSEFAPVIKEIRALSGEHINDANWICPPKYIN